MEKNLIVGNGKFDELYLITVGGELYLLNVMSLDMRKIAKDELEKIRVNYSSMTSNLSSIPAFERFADYCESGVNPTIVTSFKCNYSCSYCYQKQNGTKEIEGLLTPNGIDHIIHFYNYFSEKYDYPISYNTLRIVGGEPFLRENMDTIYCIPEKMPSNDIEITTNGTYINLYGDFIKKHKSHIKIKVSLDGTKSMHLSRRLSNENDSYDKTISGIDFLRSEDIDTTVVSVFSADYIDDYSSFFDEMEKHGWLKSKNIKLAFIPEVGCGADDISPYSVKKNIDAFIRLKMNDKRASNVLCSGLFPGANCFSKAIHDSLLDRYVNYRCGSLYKPDYAFLPNGTVSFCLSAPAERGKIGTFLPTISINEEIIEKIQQRQVRKMGKCSRCRNVNFCKGGCVATLLAKNLSLDDTYCELWDKNDYWDYCEVFLQI